MIEVSQETIEQIRDTINSLGPRITQIVENSSPAPYVTKNLEISEISLVVAIIAAIFGMIGALYGRLGYKWSKETAKNVAHIGIKAQLSIAEDFIQELYRRMVYARAMSLATSRVTPNTVSSLKLPAFSDYFQDTDYKTNEDVYILLLEIKQRVIDYNNTVDICISHLENDNTLSKKDLQDLERKPARVLRRVISLCEQVSGNNGFGIRVLQIIVKLHNSHVECDGYPDKKRMEKYVKNDGDNLLYASAIDSICSQAIPFPSSLIELMKQGSLSIPKTEESLYQPMAQILSKGTIQKQDVINWFCFVLLLDGAMEVHKIS